MTATLFPAPASADDAAALLAKHKAFTGWQFNDPGISRQDVSMTESGKDGKPLRVTHVLRVGAIYRSDVHDVRASADSSQGFTGNIFWYSDQNGFTVPIIGDAAKMALAKDFFFTDAVAQLSWKVTGTTQRWGSTFTTVRVEHPGAGKIDLYVDPVTGSYAGATFNPGGDNEETIHVTAYSDIGGGKKSPSAWQYEDSSRHTVVTAVKTGVDITNDQLHPPAATATWEFANAKPFPIRLTKDRIVLTARINGVEGHFLLDSGAADIFISGNFAHRAGLTDTGKADFYTLYGRETNHSGLAKTLEIGGNTLNNVHLYYGSAEFDGDAPDGLLGYGMLAGALMTVDFEHSQMQIQDPAQVDDATMPGVHVNVDLNSGQPVTPMFVQGKTTTVNALLDTGSPRVILIDMSLVSKYGLHMTGASVLGGCGFLDDMTLGPIVYDKPNACTEDGWGTHSALLGYDFLKGLSKLSFDYSKSRLVLLPRSKTYTP